MAKQALTWPDELPPSEKRETKVVRLLRSGGSHWGVTESQAEFVYPRSLRPLRKIAGVQEDGASTIITTPVKDWDNSNNRTRQSLEVSALLDEVFPTTAVAMKAGEERLDGGGACAGSATAATHHAADLGNTCGVVDGEHGNRNSGGTMKSETAGVSREEEVGKAGGQRGQAKKKKKKKKLARPTFYPYGNGNTAPSAGGVVYGSYMLSHSISPQVLPNKPRTRQVHSSTQRVAARVAARAKTATGASRSGRAKTTLFEANNHNSNSNNHGKLLLGRGDGEGYGGVLHGRGGGGVEEEREMADLVDRGSSFGSGSTAVFDPVSHFSALPEDTEQWNLAATHRASVAPASGTKPRSDRSACHNNTTSGTRGISPRPPAPQHYASVSAENGVVADGERQVHECARSIPPRCLEIEEEEASFLSLSSGVRPSCQAWTEDRRLMNDPRNYKFLPRGWAGELITPAGIAAPELSSGEALLSGARAGRKGRGACCRARSSTQSGGGDENGVGDCLRWNTVV